MSIKTTLETCLEQEMLFEVRPIVFAPTRLHRRYVYATPQVLQELDSNTCRYCEPGNAMSLRAFIDNFTQGKYMTVGDGANPDVDIKVLNPVQDEVWELRKTDRPSTRIFGRFALRDVFIATNIRTSDDLFSIRWPVLKPVFRKISERLPVWESEMRHCKAIWRQLFPAHQPVTGGNLNDYLTTAIDERRQSREAQ